MMHRRRNPQQHNSSNVILENGDTSSSSNSSSSATDYNPINMINKEMNEEEYRRLLKKVDTMREILRMEKISLPQIVVVGDQSVGKSSILEAISGVELPRAQSICTRCPLELRMKKAPHNTQDYATIRCDGINEVTINDLSEIANKVIECTNFLTGNLTGVSSSPIFLTVYKQDIQDDLTLIDLPGITRTVIDGQSPTIYREIVALIESCVKHESAVVLHVIPSSVDFTTSESIQICHKYDSRYERQIIAVSKIDKHDKGIGEKLQGMGFGSINLPLGCVAVLNRKQEEIDAKVPFEEMRRREQEFFRTNPAFQEVPAENLGSSQLIKKLVLIQKDRIQRTLPLVLEQVKEKIRTAKEEMKRFPAAITTETDARIAFNEILKNYRRAVEQRSNGDYEIKSDKAGAVFDRDNRKKWDDRIAYHLKMIGQCNSDELKNIFSTLSSKGQKSQVMQAIDENYGGGLPNFPSSNIIQQLYQPYHKQFEKPCTDMILWVEEYMTACLLYILDTILPAEANYKASLSYELSKVIRSVIQKSKDKCMESLKQVLEMEEKVFTVNPQYMTTFEQLKAHISPIVNGTIPSHDVLLGLRAYCSIVHARLVDHLSQLCDYWFIRNGVLILDVELNAALSPADLLKHMKDPLVLEKKRDNLRRTIEVMEKALAAAESD